jgi:transposase
MDSYSQAAMERAMKVQEVILRAMAKKITWWQAEIIGISDRQMRRWRERYEEHGFDGLFERRRGQPSPKRVPLAVVEQVLGLYRERYFDLNVRHFREKLVAEHGIELSYTWVKAALQGAGLVKRGRKRGVHRQRRPRRPLPGMLLHIDGSHHRWFQDERWYDLLVILDDATSQIYYAQRVEEESTQTVMAGARGDRAPGAVLRAVQRSRQPLLAHAEGGRQGGRTAADRALSGPDIADRAAVMAWHASGLQRNRAPSPGRRHQPHLRTPSAGAVHRQRRSPRRYKNVGAKGCGKDGGGRLTKNRTFHLLRTQPDQDSGKKPVVASWFHPGDASWARANARLPRDSRYLLFIGMADAGIPAARL